MMGRIASATLALLMVLPTLSSRASTVREDQWHLDVLHIDQAHQLSTGRGVTVGVIDTGVDASHPDLAGTVLPGTDLVGLNAGDGHLDQDGHGTAMAGIIGAHGQATGIAP